MSETSKTTSAPRGALAEFVRGATRPSIPALVGTLLVAAVPYAIATFFLSLAS